MKSARLFFGVSFGGEGAGRRFCMVLHDCYCYIVLGGGMPRQGLKQRLLKQCQDNRQGLKQRL